MKSVIVKWFNATDVFTTVQKVGTVKNIRRMSIYFWFYAFYR